MNKLPGMLGEIGFGTPTKPLPDWRDADMDESDDDAPPTPEERKALVGMLGFDPAELDDGE